MSKMCEFQSNIDFSVQINKFINIDLFARGFYQIRLGLKLLNCKTAHKIEIVNSTSSVFQFSSISSSPSITSLTCYSPDGPRHPAPSEANIVFDAHTSVDTFTSKTFQIIYKNEEVVLEDILTLRVSLCLDSADLMKQFEKIAFQLTTELLFNEKDYVVNATTGFEWVSFRHLILHFDLYRGLHYNLPVMFDYFHLSAVMLTIHASLVSICEPYISSKSDSSLWLTNYLKSEYKEDKRTAGRNANGGNELKKANLNVLQIQRLETTQIQLLSLIISAFITLKRKMNEYFRILPPWQQAKIKFESMFVDVNLDNLTLLTKECFVKIDSVDNFANLPKSMADFQQEYCRKSINNNDKLKADELANSIAHDMAYLSGLTIDQWNRFLLLVSNSERINQHLAKIHHLRRIKRFSEGFFCIEQPRPNLFGICDLNSAAFFETTELVRKSAYFNLLPPCEVECVSVDGLASSMPIIYEEKYESTPVPNAGVSFAKRNSNVNKSDDFHMSKCSSPSKYSSSSSSSSSNSSRINSKGLFAKINYRTDRTKKSIIMDDTDVANNNTLLVNQIDSFDILDLYNNELLMFERNPNVKKVLSNLLNGKELLSNCSKELSDKRLKLIASEKQTKLTNFLKDTIGWEQPFAGGFFDFKQPEIRRSWPNLVPLEQLAIPSSNDLNNEDVHYKSDSVLDEDTNGLGRVARKKKTSRAKCGRKSRRPIEPKLLLANAYKNFTGTMYFPKPPKEFIIDEPAEEVSSKPIPISIEVTSCEEVLKSDTTTTKTLEDMKLNERSSDTELDNLKSSAPITTSVSCQNLLESVSPHKHSQACHKLESTNLSYHKSNSFNETKLTFVELLRSDHCLICCGNIKNRLDGSWLCMCKKNRNAKKPTSLSAHTSPPMLRRVAAIDSDLIAFLHAKEDLRANISPKIKNLIFYSDYHSLASKIPYFQCEPEFRAFNSHKELHLIVCVHGLDGNSADLRLIRTYLELGLPMNNFDFLMSQRNQGETFDSLDTLTSRLVNEIDNYVSTYGLKPTRLSFIGHSLGNIIIRAAIARADFNNKWRDKFHTFLSLSGPHLGLAYNRSGLVNMGLWVLQRLKKAISINQLTMKDSSNVRQTYLYKLSTKPGLELFRNILLCGSSQDYYVPIHSAHIELCNAALNDNSENGVAYREMTNNILERLGRSTNVNIVRYDVHHALASNANSFIGRAAHIAVLDSELFIEKFMVVVGLKYFM